MLTQIINIVILSGALSFMPPDIAQTVMANRSTGQAEPTLNFDATAYDCQFAVPAGYAYLIGQMGYFRADDGRLYGPYPIIDVQADDAPDMQDDGLVADVTCEWLVHRHGRLVVFVGGD